LVKEIIVEKDTIIVRHCIPLTSHAEPKEQLIGQADQSSYQVCTRRDHPALRGSAAVLHLAFGSRLRIFFHDSRPQPSFD
jgi:hypothetical protein